MGDGNQRFLSFIWKCTTMYEVRYKIAFDRIDVDEALIWMIFQSETPDKDAGIFSIKYRAAMS